MGFEGNFGENCIRFTSTCSGYKILWQMFLKRHQVPSLVSKVQNNVCKIFREGDVKIGYSYLEYKVMVKNRSL